MVSGIGYKLNSPYLIAGFGRGRVHAGSCRLTGCGIKQGYTLPEAIKNYTIQQENQKGTLGRRNIKEYIINV